MSPRVAVLGAGASGLTAIKCCLDEGLTPVCFERTDHIGGLWYYTDTVTDGQSCVMKSTVINTSKEIMTYSDFPIPAEFPVFMHNTKVLEYLEMYADHFHAEKYIEFRTEVVSVSPAEGFEETGQWQVEIRNREGQTRTEVFDGVMVCTGHHAEKNVPELEGLREEFSGSVVHTHDYRHHVGYENKNVLVVGIGNSGGDVAVELSRIAKEVYISTRRGSWVFNRISTNGYPGDLLFLSRFADLMGRFIPRSIRNNLLETQVNKRFDHANYGLKPDHRIDAQHPMVNDEFPNRLACGSIKVRPGIRRFTKSGVEFTDGSRVDDLDAVILATGYKFGFPFVNHPALEVKDNQVNLYKYVFPPDLAHGTLAVIGCVQPIGALMPISEVQCRWAARIFEKAACLPPPSRMWEDVYSKQEAMKRRYVDSPRHTIQVDFIPYMDEIADQFGAKPDCGALFLKDPALALRTYFGSFCPYQYRLTGPGQWDGARQAIETVWDRTLAGTKSYRTPAQATHASPVILYVLAVIVFTVIGRWALGAVL